MARIIFIIGLLIIGSMGFTAGKKYANDSHAERRPEITIAQSDNMAYALPINPYDVFEAEFSGEKWILEMMAEREPFAPDQIFWNAYARAIADTGTTWAVVEYHEEATDAVEAVRLVMEKIRQSTDTLIIRQSITGEE